IIVDGRGYLVPMDGDARNVVSLDWVKDVLSKARAKSKVLILDACHAGSAAKGVGGIAPSLVAGAGGLVMLLSSAADQVSYPDEATGLSVFSKHLVEGLSGAADANADKAVTFAEVAVYVKRRLKDWYVETGKVQTPVILPEALPAMILAHCNGKRPPTPGVRPESPATRPLAFRVPSGFRAKAGTAAEPYTKTGWAKEIVHEATGIELVFIPAGEFLMGSPASEAQRDDDETQHRVTISRPFYMGKYEVAQGEWQRVMGSNPSYFKGSDRLPVHEGSWADCQSFCQSFCRKFGVSVRLPTESEWEYACRASTKTAFHTGATISRGTVNYDADNAYAKGLIGVHGGKVMDVGRFQANGWGLYDMHGNADEWCADWYGEYPLGPVTDPAGPDSGAKRVLRGGDWTNSPKYCRSANRNGFAPNGHYLGIGFRVVLEFE
ncbi:MAG TPA: SUMF1/EgtB/PvdO family nonheme iron enzyme, partial [Phycisphaerae bacterium]|nr:SUMF1/EgtB/PvdO family nonheme iron enzyme [Phycisphaerae bacterium]